jgi:hypothetical protein
MMIGYEVHDLSMNGCRPMFSLLIRLTAACLIVFGTVAVQPLKAGLINVKLSGPYAEEHGVRQFEIDPMGRFVVFTTAAGMYSVPIDGSENPTKVADGWIEYFMIDATGSKVIFMGGSDPVDSFGLYVVPIEGGAPLVLQPAPATGRGVYYFKLSPDNQYVVYYSFHIRSEPNGCLRESVLSIPLAGGAAIDLTDWVAPFDSIAVNNYSISPDSSRVFFRVNRDLYSVPITGESHTLLNHTLAPGDEVEGLFWVTNDSQRAIYQVRNHLYSVPVQGGDIAELNPTAIEASEIKWVALSPDSQHVVYLADEEVDGLTELYSVSVDGEARVKLSDAGTQQKSVLQLLTILKDSASVLYVSESQEEDVYELLQVPMTGGASNWIADLPAQAHIVYLGLKATPDQRYAVYWDEQDGSDHLFSVNLLSGMTQRITADMNPTASADWYQIAPDSSRVVYRADQETDSAFSLYTTPIAGGSVHRLNAGLAEGGDLYSHFAMTTHGSYVVYRGDQEVDGRVELFAAFDDPPAIEFEVASLTVGEGAERAEFAITLNDEITARTTISYVITDMTATPGLDFRAPAGPITFEPDQRRSNLAIEIVNDVQDEPDEWIQFALHTPINGLLGEDTTATLEIIDDDMGPVVSRVYFPLCHH